MVRLLLCLLLAAPEKLPLCTLPQAPQKHPEALGILPSGAWAEALKKVLLCMVRVWAEVQETRIVPWTELVPWRPLLVHPLNASSVPPDHQASAVSPSQDHGSYTVRKKQSEVLSEVLFIQSDMDSHVLQSSFLPPNKL